MFPDTAGQSSGKWRGFRKIKKIKKREEEEEERAEGGGLYECCARMKQIVRKMWLNSKKELCKDPPEHNSSFVAF